MKKTRKQKKLIVTIAIILIVVILAIIITTNIISNNNQISNEGYFATTANANSNLVASYIKEGITIGGITGTLEVLDTSDADATPEDISWGKTGYVNGVKITGTRIDTVAQAKESQQTFIENKILLDDYGNSVKVPAGFKIAEDSATSVTGGVVIEDVSAPGKTADTKGSQFVWIPVGDVITDTDGSTTKIELGRYDFDEDGTEHIVQSAENGNWNKVVTIDSYYQELETSSYGNATAKNLGDFVAKALSSGGYYIGRYEADSLSGENPISGSQNDASSMAREMYHSNNLESDLVNSYAWDTAIVFIQQFSGDKNYSMQIGNNIQNYVVKSGESILENVDSNDEKRDVRCNIYDMAGNAVEWSTETSTDEIFNGVARGGYYDYGYKTSSRREVDETNNEFIYSFRTILYL